MNERIIIGGNNPPSESEISSQRLDSYKKESDLINALALRDIPASISSDEEAGKVADYIKSLKLVRSDVEKIFKNEKEPFLAATKVADTWKNNKWAIIDSCIDKAMRPIVSWNKVKEEAERARQLELARKAQEEAERLAKEAQEHAAAGIADTANDLLNAAIEEENKSSALTNNAENNVRGRTVGVFSTASNRKVWVGIIENRALVDLETLRKYFSDDDLNKAIRAAIKDGMREIRGVKIIQDDKITIR